MLSPKQPPRRVFVHFVGDVACSYLSPVLADNSWPSLLTLHISIGFGSSLCIGFDNLSSHLLCPLSFAKKNIISSTESLVVFPPNIFKQTTCQLSLPQKSRLGIPISCFPGSFSTTFSEACDLGGVSSLAGSAALPAAAFDGRALLPPRAASGAQAPLGLRGRLETPGGLGGVHAGVSKPSVAELYSHGMLGKMDEELG